MIEGTAGIGRMLVVAMVLDINFWAAWFVKPSLVTDVHTDLFIQYEQAFPLGHIIVLGWVVLAYMALGSNQLPGSAVAALCGGG